MARVVSYVCDLCGISSNEYHGEKLPDGWVEAKVLLSGTGGIGTTRTWCTGCWKEISSKLVRGGGSGLSGEVRELGGVTGQKNSTTGPARAGSTDGGGKYAPPPWLDARARFESEQVLRNASPDRWPWEPEHADLPRHFGGGTGPHLLRDHKGNTAWCGGPGACCFCAKNVPGDPK